MIGAPAQRPARADQIGAVAAHIGAAEQQAVGQDGSRQGHAPQIGARCDRFRPLAVFSPSSPAATIIVAKKRQRCAQVRGDDGLGQIIQHRNCAQNNLDDQQHHRNHRWNDIAALACPEEDGKRKDHRERADDGGGQPVRIFNIRMEV